MTRKKGQEQEHTSPNRAQTLPSSGRVLVALSGGVDSSVAAWLLKEQGMEVVGVTFQMFPAEEGETLPGVPLAAPSVVERVNRVGDVLQIPVHTVDLKPTFHDKVIRPFCDAYGSGSTPNPCVICNPGVKWAGLLNLASEMDCGFVATGHYARIDERNGRFRLLRGRDRDKDQSYALYRLGQEALKRTILPLGNEKKDEVRLMAQRAMLPTWDVKESQDVCFIPQGGIKAFLSHNVSARPGPVLDQDGNRVGTHNGLPFYTVGQRKGLGIPFGKPMYVIEKRPKANSLIVGPSTALRKTRFSAEWVRWVSTAPPPPEACLEVDVEVRYRSTPIPGRIEVLQAESVLVRVGDHNQAVAPGQSVVWYQRDVLIGGGIIQR